MKSQNAENKSRFSVGPYAIRIQFDFAAILK